MMRKKVQQLSYLGGLASAGSSIESASVSTVFLSFWGFRDSVSKLMTSYLTEIFNF